MVIVYSFAFVVIGLMILMGHDPLRLIQLLIVQLRTLCFYAQAAHVVISREHKEMWRWAQARAQKAYLHEPKEQS